MANEFERIPNPDSLPGDVSTGYQLQNTNLVSQRVGLDCSVVIGGTGECVLEISGPVDVNGEIYTCNAQVTFTLTTAGKYYIHLAGSGANLTPTIGTGANTFDPDKNARYTDAGTYRVLNWVIYYDGTTAVSERWHNITKDDNLFEKIDIETADIVTSNIGTAFLTNPLNPKNQYNSNLDGLLTNNQIFDALDAYIPNIGDKIKINGTQMGAGVSFITICSYAERFSSTTINIIGMRISDGISVTFPYINGNSSTATVNFSW